MINDDLLIKVVRLKGHKTDWPPIVREMRKRIHEMKLGFPGIRNNHLSLIQYGKLNEEDWFIVDPYFESPTRGIEAPVLYRSIGSGRAIIEGIGCGKYDVRNIRWMDEVNMPELSPDALVFRFDARPDPITGGPAYYYIYKAYRDMRF